MANIVGIVYNQNEEIYNLENYNHEKKFRLNREGGGVSLLLDENIQYNNREDLSTFNDTIESIFVEINNVSNGPNTVVGAIYRPPGTNLDLFNEELESILEKIKHEKKTCYLLGDFNINLLHCDTHAASSDFINLLYSYLFLPCINRPTRITERSATLIDNIFTNNINNEELVINGILYNDISDHCPVFHISHSCEIHINETQRI